MSPALIIANIFAELCTVKLNQTFETRNDMASSWDRDINGVTTK